MSWHFLQGQEAASWGGTSLDGAPSALLSLMPTPEAFCLSASATGCCHHSPSGTTCGPSTANHGQAPCMSSAADSRARTLATLDIRSESRVRARAYGQRWPASLARFDHVSSSWKTSQRCLVEGWEQFSQTWPGWGLMRDGECWALETLVAPSCGSGYGLWPTLKASDGEQYSRNFAYFKRRQLVAPDLPVIVALSTPATPMGFYGRLNPDWCEWLMGWPIGWTAFGSLATAKTPECLQQHGECLEGQ